MLSHHRGWRGRAGSGSGSWLWIGELPSDKSFPHCLAWPRDTLLNLIDPRNAALNNFLSYSSVLSRHPKLCSQAGGTALRVKVSAAKPDDLNPIPGTNMVEARLSPSLRTHTTVVHSSRVHHPGNR